MNMPLPPAAPARPGAFACPACRTSLVPGVRSCGACGVSLVSSTAARLWAVEQEIARLDGSRGALLREAEGLRARLVAEAVRAGGSRPVFRADSPLSGMSAVPPTPPAPAAGAASGGSAHGLGGQQLLLGLGAFLLLSGAAFFLWIVWEVIGVTGQASVMLVLTAAAAGAARWATRRHLPAAAETAAVIASGLLALDITAAHRLGLLGLDEWDGNLYFGLGGALAALLLVGFDRLVPAADADEKPLRPIVTYWPLAGLVASASAWHLLGLVDSPRAVVTSAMLLLVALVGSAVALAAHRLDHRGPRLERVPVSMLLAALPATAAVVAHLASALAAGYGPGAGSDRWLAAGLLAVVPTACLARARTERSARPDTARTLGGFAVIGYALVLGIALWVASREVLVLVAALAGVGLVLLVALPVARAEHWWPRVAQWLLAGLSVVLWLLLIALDSGRASSMVDLLNGRTAAAPAPWWLPVVPLTGLLVQRALIAVRSRSGPAQVLLQVVVVAVLTTALRRAEVDLWLWSTLLLAVASVLLAAVVAWRTPVRTSLAVAHPAEWVHLGAGTVFTVLAFLAATEVGTGEQLLVCLVLALAFVAHASRPGRPETGFATVLLVSAACWVFVADAGAEQVEAYTLVPALALLAMGLLLWRVGKVGSSAGVMAPALLVGLFPSALVALGGEDVLRTVLVTLASMALLLAGCAARWKAPVVAGALALVGVGWSQGGVLIAWLPGWSLLVGAGAVLLAVGVMWEQALALGRRSTGWVSSLW